MTLTYHKSNTDGTIGSEIADNDLDALFDPLSAGQIINGDTVYDKLWLTPDADATVHVGVGDGSLFQTYVFQSANDSDAEGDLTGSETRYGGAEVTDNPSSDTLVVAEDTNYTIWRSGDKILFDDGTTHTIDTVSTSNGETTLTLTDNVGTHSHEGKWISSVIITAMTANTDYPFWVEQVIPANYDTQNIGENTVKIWEMY